MTDSSSWSALPAAQRARLRAGVLARDPDCKLGLPGCTGRSTTADHIRARETAGDGLDNLRGACLACNLRRGDPRKYDIRPLPPERNGLYGAF